MRVKEIHVLLIRYWNGSGSLQINQKFQNIAEELISRYLNESRYSNSSSDELSSKQNEVAVLRAQLNQMQAENERIKKRLQNEEEIQRTIEMTDQDLVRFFTLIFLLSF